jgi:ribonucleoside-diphosphate reductase alpha chain
VPQGGYNEGEQNGRGRHHSRTAAQPASGSAAGGGLRVERVWTTEGVHPYDEVEWERRDVVMTNWRDGSINFEQRASSSPRSGA